MLVITPSGPALEGQSYSLTCGYIGDESLAVSETTLRWDKVAPTIMKEVFRGVNYSFAALTHDDEGKYRCVSRITSPYLSSRPVLTQTVTISLTCK